MLARIYSTLYSVGLLNAGCRLPTARCFDPKLTLAHIQPGAKHDTVTQYWANLGQRRRRWASIRPALGERVVFDHLHTHMHVLGLHADSMTDRQTDRQNVLFAMKITTMMINNETLKRQVTA